jgi:hypothetical protein
MTRLRARNVTRPPAPGDVVAYPVHRWNGTAFEQIAREAVVIRYIAPQQAVRLSASWDGDTYKKFTLPLSRLVRDGRGIYLVPRREAVT